MFEAGADSLPQSQNREAGKPERCRFPRAGPSTQQSTPVPSSQYPPQFFPLGIQGCYYTSHSLLPGPLSTLLHKLLQPPSLRHKQLLLYGCREAPGWCPVPTSPTCAAPTSAMQNSCGEKLSAPNCKHLFTCFDLGPTRSEPQYFKEESLLNNRHQCTCFIWCSPTFLAEITADYCLFPKASEIFVAPSTTLNHKPLHCSKEHVAKSCSFECPSIRLWPLLNYNTHNLLV